MILNLSLRILLQYQRSLQGHLTLLSLVILRYPSQSIGQALNVTRWGRNVNRLQIQKLHLL